MKNEKPHPITGIADAHEELRQSIGGLLRPAEYPEGFCSFWKEMQNLPRAMWQTNRLLRAELADIQRLADNGCSDTALRRRLYSLVRYELNDREVRTDLLVRMTDLLTRLGPDAAMMVGGRPWRRKCGSARRP
ncbi:MAG TPA: hypothetical protein VGZ73_05155 [Bryobacteraceae bacterium]|jgi:hypothetical protein|nr:hypothetical protein [Bryobacteraceae bacterium]